MDLNSHGNRNIYMVFRIQRFSRFGRLAKSSEAVKPRRGLSCHSIYKTAAFTQGI